MKMLTLVLVVYLIVDSVINSKCLAQNCNDLKSVSSLQLNAMLPEPSDRQFKSVSSNRQIDSQPIVVKTKSHNREWKPEWPEKLIKATVKPEIRDSDSKWRRVKWPDSSEDKRIIDPGISFHELDSATVDKPKGLYTGRPIEMKTVKEPWKTEWKVKKRPDLEFNSLKYLIRSKYMSIYWRFWKQTGRSFGLKSVSPKSKKHLRLYLFQQFVHSMDQWKFWNLFGSGLDALWPSFYYD